MTIAEALYQLPTSCLQASNTPGGWINMLQHDLQSTGTQLTNFLEKGSLS